MKASIVFLGDYLKVDLYSISVIGEDGVLETNEFEKFSTLMNKNGGRDLKQFKEIEILIKEITDYTGANEKNFRSEGLFSAIPNNSYTFWDSDGIFHYGQRQYCIRVSNEILILLNGCSKTAQNPMDCPNCRAPFIFAKSVAIAFYDALNVNKTIYLEDRYIIDTNQSEDENIEDIILII